MYKRLFAAMTALCLMLTLMPVSVLAAEEEPTVHEAFKTAYDADEMTWNVLFRAMLDYIPKADTAEYADLKAYYESIEEIDRSTQSITDSIYSGTDTGAFAPLKGLTTLHLNDTDITDLGGLAGLTELTALDVSNNPGITDAAYGALNNLTNLETLNISGTGITVIQDVWTGSAARFPYLTELYANDLALTSVSGLVELTNADGFNAAAVTWDLGNSVLEADPHNHIGMLKTAFAGHEEHLVAPLCDPEASIGDVYYQTLAEAVAEAENEDMITVLQDVSVPNGGIVLNEDKEITIDLNGKTISAEEDTAGDGVFHITDGTLILEDSSEGEGTVNGRGQNIWSIGIWADDGDLIINGGSYTNVGAGEDDHYDLIYVSKTSQVEINGGTFKCHTPAWTLNQKDADRETSSIAVKGGSFYQFDPNNNLTEGEGTSFVAEGYVSEKDGDNYIVREYVASELTTDIGEIEFVIGVPTEFTFTTTANDDKGTMVIGTSNFSDAEAIEKLEYYEVQNDTWIELTGDFGPAAGFPMADATSKFRVTFKTAGDYSFTASMKHAETDAIVCSTVVEFTVTDLSAEAPTESAPVTESYDVAIADSTNGRVAVNTMRAGETSRVTLTVKADAGYVLESLTVTDKNGKEIKVTEKDGKYQFRMPASDVTVKAVFAAEADIEDETFTDVAEDAYYHDAVLWAVEKGITNGMTESTFAPNATCTRAQMVTFLWRAAGCPVPQNAAHSFTDLDKDAYYYNAVLWAVEKGITNGVSLDAFDPNGTVTRGQAMTFLWRMDGKTAADADHAFTDVEDGAYYEDAVAWGADEAITNGTSATTFSPDDACIRGQIVTFLYNYLVK